MKRILFAFVVLSFIIFFGSCKSTREVVYFQNIDSINLVHIQGQYVAKIVPNDELTISVITSDPVASAPFNLSVQQSTSAGRSTSGSSGLLSYLVDERGYIMFPVIGKIHVAGLTTNQCQELIHDNISKYMASNEKPVVTVRISSYRVTVIGEVGGSRVIPVNTEKMSIMEALASAGNITLQGKYKNVLLVREDAAGNKTAHRLDLTDANIINSPYFYLQQNDLIYVEPNKTKIRNSQIGASTTLVVSIIGILSSITSLIVTLAK